MFVFGRMQRKSALLICKHTADLPTQALQLLSMCTVIIATAGFFPAETWTAEAVCAATESDAAPAGNLRQGTSTASRHQCSLTAAPGSPRRDGHSAALAAESGSPVRPSGTARP